LLSTGKSHPEQITDNETTALIKSCKNKMTDISLKLLNTCNSMPSHENKFGFTALYWVNKNNLSSKLKTKLLEMLDKCKKRKTKKRTTFKKRKTMRRRGNH